MLGGGTYSYLQLSTEAAGLDSGLAQPVSVATKDESLSIGVAFLWTC